MKQLYLIRHCSAEGQEAEASLTKEGRNQAVQLANTLGFVPFDKLYSSPFRRATQSIEPLALALDKPITIDDRLSERKLTAEPIDNWLEELEKTFNDPSYKLGGGESSEEAACRGLEVLEEAIQHTKEVALLMTHGNLLTLLLRHFESSLGFDTWKSLTNPDIYCLTFKDDCYESMKHINLERQGL
ncbi:histidine phosphatase family protein [Pseudalkalibacillus hwajinpoensis]|uniref:Histidine phosphatase family protein n=1 Tax=Guptibacillus hwajinpoensis TaxID=208199 RepID=A0A4U1MEF9_9BACL|nr:histidine phosphatase family protein [Pseudalkalibacillus hwajinpoensis]TKD68755.1 histidine phosphatase family protein [Pseudalkalibacillus hwajinpoensis]